MTKKQELNTLFHSSFSINFHLVLMTKYRHQCIDDDIFDFLKENIQRLLERAGCHLIEMNGESDHVHILFSASPKVQPSKVINTLKATTSRLVRNNFGEKLKPFYWKPIFWNRTYCLISTGGVSLDVVKEYIKNQDGYD